MHDENRSTRAWLVLRLGVVAALVVLGIGAGLWLGEKSVPGPDDTTEQAGQEPAAVAVAVAYGRTREAPPVFFFANVPPDGDWTIALDQMRLAADAGVRQYVVPVPLPWPAPGPSVEVALDRLGQVQALVPEARFLLYVTLDPPEAWREAHPEAMATVAGRVLPSVCLASERWLDDVQQGIETLVQGLADTSAGARVLGYVIACLEHGQWSPTEAYDTGAVNATGFRVWLRARYGNDVALETAWADDTVTLDTAAVPDRPDTANPHEVFFPLPAGQRHVDYLRYRSDQTADAIAAVTWYIKEATDGAAQVLAPYGFSFELERNDAGHFALARIIDSDIDGFVSPVSYRDRGLAGAGGPMGPVDSVTRHGKQWYLVDDTRTGITRDRASEAIGPIEGARMRDVYHVQQRNFAAALTHGLGLFWCDPEGEGALHDADMWDRLGAMSAAYEAYRADQAARGKSGPSSPPWPTDDRFLTVVVDETSRCYQQCDAKLNRIVLTQARDCVLHTGVPARFCLLQDVLEERVPQSPAYLFLNAFQLQEDARRRLHALLAEYGAAAIWLYAPGYITDQAAVENVSATTRMGVKAFEEPALSGSAFHLAGTWLGEKEPFGESLEWAPLFYIEDDEADVIAHYRDSGRPSAAIAFLQEDLEQEWASVFLAEPALTPGLLREILHILGLQSYFQKTAVNHFDAAYFGPNLLGVHAKDTGERSINLGTDVSWDVQDLLDPEVGWLQKRSFILPLRVGQTRLLHLTPVGPSRGR